MIQTFARAGAAKGTKYLNRTTGEISWSRRASPHHSQQAYTCGDSETSELSQGGKAAILDGPEFNASKRHKPRRGSPEPNLERIPKSGNRFSDKNARQIKQLERLFGSVRTKIALGSVEI